MCLMRLIQVIVILILKINQNLVHMAHLHKRMAFHNDNKFIPKYVPNNLKWYERDDLDTWYLQNKCNDVLMDTGEHFKETNIVNFDIIRNKKLEEEKLKQY